MEAHIAIPLMMITFLIVFFVPIFFVIDRQEKNMIQEKRQNVLRKIVHQDILQESQYKKNLKERLLKYYDKDEITPELIEYFDHNYLETVKIESQRLEKQRVLEEQRDKELDRTLNALEDRQKTQLDAFKSVKELNQQSTGAQ